MKKFLCVCILGAVSLTTSSEGMNIKGLVAKFQTGTAGNVGPITRRVVNTNCGLSAEAFAVKKSVFESGVQPMNEPAPRPETMKPQGSTSIVSQRGKKDLNTSTEAKTVRKTKLYHGLPEEAELAIKRFNNSKERKWKINPSKISESTLELCNELNNAPKNNRLSILAYVADSCDEDHKLATNLNELFVLMSLLGKEKRKLFAFGLCSGAWVTNGSWLKPEPPRSCYPGLKEILTFFGMCKRRAEFAMTEYYSKYCDIDYGDYVDDLFSSACDEIEGAESMKQAELDRAVEQTVFTLIKNESKKNKLSVFDFIEMYPTCWSYIGDRVGAKLLELVEENFRYAFLVQHYFFVCPLHHYMEYSLTRSMIPDHDKGRFDLFFVHALWTSDLISVPRWLGDELCDLRSKLETRDGRDNYIPNLQLVPPKLVEFLTPQISGTHE